MIDRVLCVALLVIVSVGAGVAQAASSSDKPTESPHHRGPDGLESWTLDIPASDGSGQRYPRTLVIARNGHILRKITGDPLVWHWIFREGGRQVAYETGPVHFVMACVLMDISTGHELARLDCWKPLAADAPEWEKALETSRN